MNLKTGQMIQIQNRLYIVTELRSKFPGALFGTHITLYYIQTGEYTTYDLDSLLAVTKDKIEII